MSITMSLLESSVNIFNLASKIKIKLGTGTLSRFDALEMVADINKLIGLIQMSPRFRNRIKADYQQTDNIKTLKQLIKKDLSKLNSLGTEDLGFLVHRLENLAMLINK